MMYKIPHIKQPYNSKLCVPVCCEMVIRALGYYDYSYKQLAKLMHYNPVDGTKLIIAARELSKLGLSTTYYEQLLGVPPPYLKKADNKIKRYLIKNQYDYYVDAMENGVDFFIKSATINIIQEKIEKGFIPIVIVRSSIFYKSKKDNQNTHAVVVKKIDNKIHILDPLQPIGKKTHTVEKYDINHFDDARVFTTNRALFVKQSY